MIGTRYITMSVCFIALLLSANRTVCLAEVLNGESDMLRPQPSCGVASVAAIVGIDRGEVSLSDIERTFVAHGVANVRDIVSAADIKKVLADYGVPVEIIRFRAGLPLTLLPVPCIAHCVSEGRPDFRPRMPPDGHFVTVVRVEGDHVWLLDLSRQPALFQEDAGRFMAHWNRVVIVSRAASERFRWTVSGLFAICLVVGVSLVALTMRLGLRLGFWRTRRSTVCGLLLLMISGCGGKENSTENANDPLLIFAKPSHHLGIVAAELSLTEQFDFQVNGKSSVRIRDVQACCGCRLADESIIGQELAPGTSHEISIAVNSGSALNPRSLFIKVITDPPSPIVPVLAVHFRSGNQVRIVPPNIVIETTKSTPDLPEIRALCLRLPSDPTVKFDAANFRSEDFELGNVTQKTVSVLQYGDKVIEETTQIPIRMKQRLSQPGVFRSMLALSWSDGSRHTIPVEIRLLPAVRLEPSRLFLGVVAPGTSLRASVRVQTVDVERVSVEKFESHSIKCTAKHDANRGRIDVEIETPTTPGHFSGNLVVTFGASNLAPITLPIIGVVRSDSNGKKLAE